MRQFVKKPSDIPALWHATTTTDTQRKEIIRQVVNRVLVNTEGNSERVQVTIEWVGGAQTQGVMIRPVAKLTQLSHYPQLCERICSLVSAGLSAADIACQLNQEGYHSPKRRQHFDRQGVQDLIHRLGTATTAFPFPEARGATTSRNKVDSPYLNSLLAAGDVGVVEGCPLYYRNDLGVGRT